jgi:hypothetical protein
VSAVQELPPSNWGENIINPPAARPPLGHQVLHFGSADHPYEESPEAIEFVEKYLQNAKRLNSDADLLRYASDQVKIEGVYLELGVCTGKSINFIAALNPGQIIYGFDSFQGNPEDWHRNHSVLPQGTFGLKDPAKIPLVLNNVKLIQGFFEQSLPYFVQTLLERRPIAFLHVDCDLYSSTNSAFQILGPYIKHGTIIVFDELYGYPEFAECEFRALTEFLEHSGYAVEYLAFNAMFEGVAVRICQPNNRGQA